MYLGVRTIREARKTNARRQGRVTTAVLEDESGTYANSSTGVWLWGANRKSRAGGAGGCLRCAITSGALLGSFRAVDASNRWPAPGGKPLLSDHPYTKVSQTPVVPGQVTRYDIEVLPTFAHLAAEHRLRLTIATRDAPHLLPATSQLPRLLGGVYDVQHHADAASFVELPLADARAFHAACTLCAP